MPVELEHGEHIAIVDSLNWHFAIRTNGGGVEFVLEEEYLTADHERTQEWIELRIISPRGGAFSLEISDDAAIKILREIEKGLLQTLVSTRQQLGRFAVERKEEGQQCQ